MRERSGEEPSSAKCKFERRHKSASPIGYSVKIFLTVSKFLHIPYIKPISTRTSANYVLLFPPANIYRAHSCRLGAQGSHTSL